MCIGECCLLCWCHALAMDHDRIQLHSGNGVAAIELARVVMGLCAVHCKVHQYGCAKSADNHQCCAFDCADDVHDVPFQCRYVVCVDVCICIAFLL